MQRFILSIILTLWITTEAHAQLIPHDMWTAATDSMGAMKRRDQVPRDGSLWRSKTQGRWAFYNLHLYFTDSSHFILYDSIPGTGITYYYSGVVNEKDSMEYHGTAWALGNNADTLKVATLVKGKYQGKYWSFNRKDSVEMTCYYSDGRLDGPYHKRKHGIPLVEGQYAKGKVSGDWKYYHPNGVILAYGEYSGETYETWIDDTSSIFEPGGKLKLRVPKRKGDWMFYDSTGSWLYTQTYSDKGELLSTKYREGIHRHPELEFAIEREILN